MSAQDKQEFFSSPTNDVLSQNTGLFRALVENSSDIVALLNIEGKVTYLSPAITRVMGYAPEELLENYALALVHPDDLEKMSLVFASIMQTPGESLRAEYRLRRQDGSWRWFEGVGTNLLHESTVGAIVGNFRDITDRKRAEEQARFHTSVAQSISDAVIATDTNYIIFSWNQAAEELYGWKQEEVIGKLAATIVPTEIVGMSALEWREELATRGYWKGEARQKRKDGTTIEVWSSTSLVKDSQGAILGAVAANRDITERKQLEQRKDDFISIASHELKTPITTLKGLTQLLKRNLEKQGLEEPVLSLATIDAQIDRLTRLINELLDVSKIQAGQLMYSQERVALDELLRDIVNTAQQTNTTHTITLQHIVHTYIIGDCERLEQVFINLISNAIKYSPQANVVEIDMSTSGEMVIVNVRDYGVGIPACQQNKIFERFYRAFDSGKTMIPGLGMGLYIAREIVNRHGGTITVTSEEEQGSTFSVSLPLAE